MGLLVKWFWEINSGKLKKFFGVYLPVPIDEIHVIILIIQIQLSVGLHTFPWRGPSRLGMR